MNDKAKKAGIIVYGQYIEHQEIGTQINHYGEEKKNKDASAEASMLTAEILRPYIDAGLLTEDLKPADGLSRGEVAVLAHDIAERLNMQRFWPVFEQKWGLRYLSSDFNRFTKTQKFVTFQKRLNNL